MKEFQEVDDLLAKLAKLEGWLRVMKAIREHDEMAELLGEPTMSEWFAKLQAMLAKLEAKSS